MSTETLLIIVVVLILLGGGGWYGRVVGTNGLRRLYRVG
jgi:hypothetical protein